MRYKLFGKHTGLRVSELVLGAGTFGTRWGHGAEPGEAGRIFNAYADAGGNFIDTANGYQFGQSEEILGDLLSGRRDDFVLATKFTFQTDPKAGILVTGNSRRAMVSSVEASLKRLKTDRVDLYWAHVSDGVTPAEEIVRGFDDLARAGKILYAGLSDFPAWRVARAATIAELRGVTPIAGLQVEHSLVERTTEQDLLPAGRALGLGIVAWSPLGGGVLTGKYRQGETGRREGFGGRAPHRYPGRLDCGRQGRRGFAGRDRHRVGRGEGLASDHRSTHARSIRKQPRRHEGDALARADHASRRRERNPRGFPSPNAQQSRDPPRLHRQ
jgi:aryl-alcohol dehydrogenase-like predicted oxidoreductase